MAKRLETFNLQITGVNDAETNGILASANAEYPSLSLYVSSYNGPISGFVGTNTILVTPTGAASAGDDAAHIATADEVVALLAALGCTS